MDISRPEFKRQKRRRQIMGIVVGLLCVVSVTVGVARTGFVTLPT
jgi:hypothetical protein